MDRSSLPPPEPAPPLLCWLVVKESLPCLVQGSPHEARCRHSRGLLPPGFVAPHSVRQLRGLRSASASAPPGLRSHCGALLPLEREAPPERDAPLHAARRPPRAGLRPSPWLPQFVVQVCGDRGEERVRAQARRLSQHLKLLFRSSFDRMYGVLYTYP